MTLSEASARVHSGKFEVDRWRGTMADVAALVQAAHDEIQKRASDDEKLYGDLRVNFEDGHQVFETVESFVEASGEIDTESISMINGWIARHPVEERISFQFGGYPGVRLSASSPDRIWAHGVADVLEEQARLGEVGRFSNQRRPLKWREWTLMAVALLMFAGVFVLVHVVADKNVVAALALAFGVSVGAIAPLGDAVDRRLAIPRSRSCGEMSRSLLRARQGSRFGCRRRFASGRCSASS